MADASQYRGGDDAGFSVRLYAENRVVAFVFHDLKRATVDAWIEHVKAHDGKLRSPMRALYDFRETGPPSRYMLDVVGPLMETLTIPEDTRSAYLFKKGPNALFSRSLQRRMPRNVGETKGFTNFDAAIQWLLE